MINSWQYDRYKGFEEFMFLGHTENMLLVMPPDSWMRVDYDPRRLGEDLGFGAYQRTLTDSAKATLAEYNGRLCEGVVPGNETFWFDFETEHDAIQFKLAHS